MRWLALASTCTGRDRRSVIWHIMIDYGLIVTYVDMHAEPRAGA